MSYPGGSSSQPRAPSPELLPESPESPFLEPPSPYQQQESETYTPAEEGIITVYDENEDTVQYVADIRSVTTIAPWSWTHASENSTVAAESSSIAAETSTITEESSTIAADSSTVAAESSSIVAEDLTIAADSSSVAAESSTNTIERLDNERRGIRRSLDEENSRASNSLTVDESTRDSARSNDFIDDVNNDSNSAYVDAEEPPAKKIKIGSPKSDEMDGETCPICLDSWGNSGDHRLVALKCGHLFGSQCVQRWLKAQPAKDRSCPTCKTRANIRDIRYIYARRLVAADTSQITSLQKQIEIIQAEKSRCELELQKSKIAHRACSMQLEGLRYLMKSQVNKEQPVKKTWRFALEKNLEICRDGGCRVLTYNYRTYELYVSQKSSNYLFPGYGIRKVSCLDYKLGQFVHLHPKPIRDITYSQPRDLLLSVGLDSTARIVERGIPSVTVNTGVPLWSCSWDYLRSNEFFVGGVGGVIHQYDVRNTSNYVQMLSAPGDISPVVSLCSTEFGLLSCQLNTCWLWVGSNRQWEPRSLPIEGSFTNRRFMSLCYDSETHRALVSCRPSANGLERSKLTLCKLKTSVPTGEVHFDIEDTFNGSARSSLMSRANWVKVPGASWVAAHSESDAALYLHGLDGARTMSLPAAEPALDVGCVELNGNSILAALSESRLRIYKAVPTNS